jgi:hypothetical protein
MRVLLLPLPPLASLLLLLWHAPDQIVLVRVTTLHVARLCARLRIGVRLLLLAPQIVLVDLWPLLATVGAFARRPPALRSVCERIPASQASRTPISSSTDPDRQSRAQLHVNVSRRQSAAVVTGQGAVSQLVSAWPTPGRRADDRPQAGSQAGAPVRIYAGAGGDRGTGTI